MQHMVCSNSSKNILVIISWFLKKLFSPLNLEIFGIESLVLRRSIFPTLDLYDDNSTDTSFVKKFIQIHD